MNEIYMVELLENHLIFIKKLIGIWKCSNSLFSDFKNHKFKFKFKFFINKESSTSNMHIWKNAQMTRTNKRIKQGNTRKIKNIITILQLYQRESYPNICRLYINNTLVYIYIYKHESALLVIEHRYIQLLIW